ncbi:MAG: hypothetical protein H7Z41_00545 [Cytophagales bacterium]|nr:hypothetical protein [Armatimonadota bacterium]
MRPTFRFRGVYDHTWAFADPMQRHIPRRYLDADESFAKLAEENGNYNAAIEALDRALKLNDLPELHAAKARCAAAQIRLTLPN